MKRQLHRVGLAVCLCLTAPGSPAHAFCGFFVGKADTKLYNKASKVVLVRDGDKTIITMANDYQGDLKEFAMVIPVPTFIEREQIHVTSNAIIEHLDEYTAPRLVEYYDEDPCRTIVAMESRALGSMPAAAAAPPVMAKELGVTVEAQYKVEEYDVLILSAEESSGLETWLKQNGYRIPEGATEVLGSYIKQGVRFFVAKVNIEEQEKLGFTFLRPLSVAFESPKFMLPIRLGTVNANGTQELFIFALTRNGRIETTNYRTVRVPSDVELPLFVEKEFSDFYTAMFSRQVEKEDMHAVFLEYAWDMNWCDPCAASPMSPQELEELGVFWGGEPNRNGGDARNAFVTRLHVRYDAAHFPEDLFFQETGDRTNFQGRYVLRHPWTGTADCSEGKDYRARLAARYAQDAKTLQDLTGWDPKEIKDKMALNGQADPKVDPATGQKWWQRLWQKRKS